VLQVVLVRQALQALQDHRAFKARKVYRGQPVLLVPVAAVFLQAQYSILLRQLFRRAILNATVRQ
jgi:hypothetical protein